MKFKDYVIVALSGLLLILCYREYDRLASDYSNYYDSNKKFVGLQLQLEEANELLNQHHVGLTELFNEMSLTSQQLLDLRSTLDQVIQKIQEMENENNRGVEA